MELALKYVLSMHLTLIIKQTPVRTALMDALTVTQIKVAHLVNLAIL